MCPSESSKILQTNKQYTEIIHLAPLHLNIDLIAEQPKAQAIYRT